MNFNYRIVTIAVCLASASSANAWKCYKCNSSNRWSDSAKFCPKCGVQKTGYMEQSLMKNTRSERPSVGWSPMRLSIFEPVGLPLDGARWDVYGVEIGLLGSRSAWVRGLQLDGIYSFSDCLAGVQLGVCNSIDSYAAGVQVGLLNMAGQIKGFQLGAINYAGRMNGFQIGAINIIANSPLPFFPLINMHF